MEKTSSTSSSPFLVLIGTILLQSIANWLGRIQELFFRFQSFLLSQYTCDNSKVRDEKNLDSESSQLPKVCKKKDDGSLSREDVNMVMGNLGIFFSSEGLPESFCSAELSGLFDENEPSLEEVKQAFDVFDENKDGFIDARELQRVLCILGLKEGSKLEDCQKMIETFDENRDGRIEFFEFVKFMEASFC
ncbi:putative EF-hand domain pair protein [Rosa chinensis]|uniref:Putative EF-hand domain pair protein n=1 Tax=Rosa chinensis TaxID=74649 RepID=A0A2P6S4E1_ROSCH|nr:probable calcium-binding protein CML46 [Rosa chinensis]PRQ53551.1 putative EF-hand domain pair protein [Rosa chinensis]